jgi:hypothetical protein
MDTPEAPDARTAALRTLDRLVGTWTVSGPGGHGGEVRYEWMDGGCWLVQHVDLHSAEGRDRGVEYVGWDEAAGELRSHFFGSRGELLEYTYRIEGDLLTIFFGGADSPARFEGRFTDDGRVNTGAWQWPGGGYETTMTRADRPRVSPG